MTDNYVARKEYEIMSYEKLKQIYLEKKEKLALLTNNKFNKRDIPSAKEKLIDKLMNTDLAFTLYETAESFREVGEIMKGVLK